MRCTALVLALTAALLAPIPAVAQEPTAPPSPAPSGPDYCTPEHQSGRGPVEVSTSSTAITAGDTLTYDLTIPGPWNRVEAGISAYQWVTPTTRGPVEEVSSSGNGSGPFGPDEAATRTVTLRPTNNTKVTWNGAVYCGPTGFHGDVIGANPVVVNVAPRLTLDAVRVAPRVYDFFGQATTPGLVLNLYRVNADGSQVLTARTRASAAGTWTLTRTFLGSGRFGFVARTGRTMANAPGSSNTRPTLIF